MRPRRAAKSGAHQPCTTRRPLAHLLNDHLVHKLGVGCHTVLPALPAKHWLLLLRLLAIVAATTAAAAAARAAAAAAAAAAGCRDPLRLVPPAADGIRQLVCNATGFCLKECRQTCARASRQRRQRRRRGVHRKNRRTHLVNEAPNGCRCCWGRRDRPAARRLAGRCGRAPGPAWQRTIGAPQACAIIVCVWKVRAAAAAAATSWVSGAAWSASGWADGTIERLAAPRWIRFACVSPRCGRSPAARRAPCRG